MIASEQHPAPWSSPRHSLIWAIGTGLLCSSVLAVMEGASVFAMLRGGNSGDSWLFTIARTLPPWLLFGACAPFLTALARRFSFERHNLWSSIAVHSIVGVLAANAHLAVFSLTYVLVKNQASFDRFIQIFTISFRYLFLVEVLTYWAIVGIYLTVRYSNIRRGLAEARLTALRAQLNPHFLFNSLHAISTMSLRGEHKEVAEMLGRLSDLLRAALDGRSQEVALSAELEFIDHYMALQRIRYGERLHVQTQIEPSALDGLVPTMILQPLVENAIKYGVSAQRGVGTVAIHALTKDGRLIVEVQDDGPGFDPAGVLPGIGLSNTQARLEQLYGRHHRFECDRSPLGGALVRITIPFRSAAATAASSFDADVLRLSRAETPQPRLPVGQSAGAL